MVTHALGLLERAALRRVSHSQASTATAATTDASKPASSVDLFRQKLGEGDSCGADGLPLLTQAYTWLTDGVTGPSFDAFLREDADAENSYSVYAPNWKVGFL